MEDKGMNVKELTEILREEITSSMSGKGNRQVYEYIQERILTDPSLQVLGIQQCRKIIRQVFYSLRSDVSILEPYLLDDTVSEIMVNGKETIFIEKEGHIQRAETVFNETEELEEVVRRVAAKVHKEINELHPIVDARLPDGSRVNIVYQNIAIGGPVMTIRKFPKHALKMTDLIRLKTITKECADFLETLVTAGYNIFISGGTSSGKTTFLNVLSEYIPKTARLVIIEDSAELQIQNNENLIRMECRNANGEGKGAVTMSQLIRTSLRMRPDRIIVGEVRGGEVLDMINAMNTGHAGSLSTGHGNSVHGMFRRLEAMYLQGAAYPADAIRLQILEAIDIFVHLGRMGDMSRKVMEVVELTGIDSGGAPIFNPLFQYHPKKGLYKTKNILKRQGKMQLKGIWDEDGI